MDQARKEKLKLQLLNLQIGEEVMDGIVKVSQGGFRVISKDGMVMFTGVEGVIDLFEALEEAAKNYGEE